MSANFIGPSIPSGMIYKFLTIIVFTALIFSVSAAYAQPTPKSKKEEVGALNSKLKSYKNEKKELEDKASAANKDYKNTKGKLVKISKRVQNNQRELLDIEARLSELDSEQELIAEELESERASMAKTISALEKIRRTPPQAMIARPGAPIETARGAMLLQRILPVLHQKAKILREKSERYAANKKELKDKKKKLERVRNSLAGEEKDLKQLVDERKQLFAKLNSDVVERKNEIAKISKQAKNLNDLIRKLEDERRTASYAKEKKKKTQHAPLPKIGKSQLPLNGVIKTRYNEEDDFGAKSKGVSIEGYGGALIVAPMGGVIRFAGYFKNYGNMLIIEHKNGYHSLVAGLEKIDTVVDQSVVAGEPLGHLYQSKSGNPPTLYFELRHKGKAIDPARKFSDLG